MKKVFQQTDKDCLKSCVCSILELPQEEVPDFCSLEQGWWSVCQDFLKTRGLCFIMVVLDSRVPWFNPPHSPLAIGIGKSQSRKDHAVVVQLTDEEFKIIHDPHPNNAGLDAVDCLAFIIPLDPANYQPERKRILTSGIVPMRRNGRI